MCFKKKYILKMRKTISIKVNWYSGKGDGAFYFVLGFESSQFDLFLQLKKKVQLVLIQWFMFKLLTSKIEKK